jgi:aldose 1-epimerase
MTRRLAIAFAGWRAEIGPSMGGAILSLSRDGVDILRRTPEAAIEAGDARASASYPLIPYANRIGQARFRFAGAEHALALNFPNSPHSLHGVGWRRVWRVVEAGPDACALLLEHRPVGSDAQDWPFAFDARQRLALDPEGLCVTIEVTNAGEAPAPAGVGLHPFFVRRPGERLRFKAKGAWTNGPDMLPADRVGGGAWDHAAGRPVDDERLDHDFFGWDGTARLSAPGEPTVRVSASPQFPVLRVYTPEAAPYLAVEPVSHRADAINHPGDPDGSMRVLQPGATLRGQVRFSLERGA